MKGGFLHNTVLVRPFERHFLQIGAEVFVEHPIECGRSPRSVDLFVRYRGDRIVIEAELTPKRIVADIQKAETLNATLLLVVMPNAAAARAAKRSLARRSREGMSSTGMGVWILSLGPALRHMKDCFPLPFNPIHTQISNQKPTPSKSSGGSGVIQ